MHRAVIMSSEPNKISNYFTNKRFKLDCTTENSKVKKKSNIFEDALVEQLKVIENVENPEPINDTKNLDCNESNCKFAILYVEKVAALEMLQKKYNATKAKYVMAMDLNLKLQEKMSKNVHSASSKENQVQSPVELHSLVRN